MIPQVLQCIDAASPEVLEAFAHYIRNSAVYIFQSPPNEREGVILEGRWCYFEKQTHEVRRIIERRNASFVEEHYVLGKLFSGIRVSSNLVRNLSLDIQDRARILLAKELKNAIVRLMNDDVRLPRGIPRDDLRSIEWKDLLQQ